VARRPEASFDRAIVEVVSRSFDGSGQSFGSSGISQAMRLSREARLVRPYAQSTIAHACIRANADAWMGIPLRIWTTKRSDTAKEIAPTDPLAKLLARPNPLMSGLAFQRALSVFLDLSGGFFLFLTDKMGRPIAEGGMPEEIWPVRDDLVTPVIDENTRLPRAWSYTAGSKAVEFPAHAVAHIYYADPHDPLKGFGPAQAAWRAADHLYRAEAFDDALVENGGQIGGIFSHEAKALGPKQLESFSASIKQNVDDPKNHGKKMVLPAGIKFTPTTMSPVDMQAKDMRLMKRDEIMYVFGVHPSIIGIMEDANRSSMRETRRVYYENTIIPRADFVGEAMTVHFLGKLPRQYHEYEVQYDYNQTAAMREDVDAQIERLDKLVRLGFSKKDAMAFIGIDMAEAEGADERYLDGTLKPIELAYLPPPAPVAPGEGGDEDEEESDDEKAALKAQVEALREQRSRDRRAAAVEAEEKRLSKADRKLKRAVREVFDDYVLAQRKRLREIAESGARGRGGVIPWHWLTESNGVPDGALAPWSRRAHEYADLMAMAPEDDGWTDTRSEGFVEVKGISEDELNDLVLGNAERWGLELWGRVSAPLVGTIEDALAAAARSLGVPVIDATNPAIVAYLQAKEIALVEGPMSVVAEQVKRALIRGMTEVGSVGTLADRVREALESLEDELRALQDRLGTRAAMIARTETAAASNAARTEQFKQSGIAQQEWASAGDDLVREGHDIDGELAIVGEKFSNGLRFPGDPEAPPSMTIQCRCIALPVISDS
jgi:HK97 family phage portal protein